MLQNNVRKKINIKGRGRWICGRGRTGHICRVWGERLICTVLFGVCWKFSIIGTFKKYVFVSLIHSLLDILFATVLNSMNIPNSMNTEYKQLTESAGIPQMNWIHWKTAFKIFLSWLINVLKILSLISLRTTKPRLLTRNGKQDNMCYPRTVWFPHGKQSHQFHLQLVLTYKHKQL